MKTLIVLFVSCILCYTQTYAQDHVFKVLASKSCMIKQGSNWVPVVRGGTLNKNSELKLAEGGYAALLHVTGKTLEIKNSGVFKTDDLAAKISTKSIGFSQKYAMFAMNQVGSSKGSEQSMNVTGAVTRGGGAVEQSPISLVAPLEIKTTQDYPLQLEWIANQSIDAYSIEVLDASKKVVLTQDAKTTNGKVDLSKVPITESMTIRVINKNNPEVASKAHSLIIINEKSAKDVVGDIDQVLHAIDQNSALDNFMMATVFEEKGLLLDALTYYKKSLTLGTDVADYKEAYNTFIIKNSIPH